METLALVLSALTFVGIILFAYLMMKGFGKTVYQNQEIIARIKALDSNVTSDMNEILKKIK